MPRIKPSNELIDIQQAGFGTDNLELSIDPTAKVLCTTSCRFTGNLRIRAGAGAIVFLEDCQIHNVQIFVGKRTNLMLRRISCSANNDSSIILHAGLRSAMQDTYLTGYNALANLVETRGTRSGLQMRLQLHSCRLNGPITLRGNGVLSEVQIAAANPTTLNCGKTDRYNAAPSVPNPKPFGIDLDAL